MKMDPFAPKTVAIALTVASFLARRAIRKKSLTPSGALTGFVVGCLLVSTGLRGLELFVFYQLGSMATKVGARKKESLDATATTSSVRGPSQVLAVSGLVVFLSIYHACIHGAERPISFHLESEAQTSRLALGILAHHACSLADTLASEFGLLSPEIPRMVGSFRQVPPGTNGGITIAGTWWSIVGGGSMGVTFVVLDRLSGIPTTHEWRIILYASLCGFVGSLLDSILGATLQSTYYYGKKVHHQAGTTRSSRRVGGFASVLNNEQVNFYSAVLTTLIGGWWLGPWMWGED